jgi:hypothetical protein
VCSHGSSKSDAPRDIGNPRTSLDSIWSNAVERGSPFSRDDDDSKGSERSLAKHRLDSTPPLSSITFAERHVEDTASNRERGRTDSRRESLLCKRGVSARRHTRVRAYSEKSHERYRRIIRPSTPRVNKQSRVSRARPIPRGRVSESDCATNERTDWMAPSAGARQVRLSSCTSFKESLLSPHRFLLMSRSRQLTVSDEATASRSDRALNPKSPT